MLNIAICDDDKETLLTIKSYINEYAIEKGVSIAVDIFLSGKDLLNTPLNYNIFLLDIILESENGIEIGKALRKRNQNAQIIYITNYRQYHDAAHNTIHSFAFLTKPISKDSLFKQLSDILSYGIYPKPIRVSRFLTYEIGLIELDIDDIYFFEYIKKRYVKISSKNGDYHFNQKISVLNNEMANYDFYMPHQSFVVNLKYVKDIKHYELIMTNGIKIPLSQKRAVLFKDALNNYLKKMLVRR